MLMAAYNATAAAHFPLFGKSNTIRVDSCLATPFSSCFARLQAVMCRCQSPLNCARIQTWSPLDEKVKSPLGSTCTHVETSHLRSDAKQCREAYTEGSADNPISPRITSQPAKKCTWPKSEELTDLHTTSVTSQSPHITRNLTPVRNDENSTCSPLSSTELSEPVRLFPGLAPAEADSGSVATRQHAQLTPQSVPHNFLPLQSTVEGYSVLNSPVKVTLLCCTRWKQGGSRSNNRSDDYSRCTGSGSDTAAAERRLDSYKDDFQSKNTNENSFSGRVICGLLVYNGKNFFEGRLQSKQLNPRLCWNETAWNRLYTALTDSYSFLQSSDFEGSREKMNTHRTEEGVVKKDIFSNKQMQEDQQKSGVYLLLHMIGNGGSRNGELVPRLNSCEATTEKAETSAKKAGRLMSWQKEAPGRISDVEGPTGKSKSADRQKFFDIYDATTGDQRTEEKAHSLRHEREASTSSGACCAFGKKGGSRQSDESETLVESCDVQLGDEFFNDGALLPERTHSQKNAHRREERGRSHEPLPAALYLSCIMQVGDAPSASFVHMTEPICLKPLPHGSGIAKLFTAALLMQQVQQQQHQSLKSECIACAESLEACTQQLSEAAAYQEKREQFILEGACKLLNEKKLKLQELQLQVERLQQQLHQQQSEATAAISGNAIRTTAAPVGAREITSTPPRVVVTAGGSARKWSHQGVSSTYRRKNGRSITQNSAIETPLKDRDAVGTSASLNLQRKHHKVSSQSAEPGESRAVLLPQEEPPSRTILEGSVVNEDPVSTRSETAVADAAADAATVSETLQSSTRRRSGTSLILSKNKELFPAMFACIRIKEEEDETDELTDN